MHTQARWKRLWMGFEARENCKPFCWLKLQVLHVMHHRFTVGFNSNRRQILSVMSPVWRVQICLKWKIAESPLVLLQTIQYIAVFLFYTLVKKKNFNSMGIVWACKHFFPGFSQLQSHGGTGPQYILQQQCSPVWSTHIYRCPRQS